MNRTDLRLGWDLEGKKDDLKQLSKQTFQVFVMVILWARMDRMGTSNHSYYNFSSNIIDFKTTTKNKDQKDDGKPDRRTASDYWSQVGWK